MAEMVGSVLNEARLYTFVNLVSTGQTGNTHLRHSPSRHPLEFETLIVGGDRANETCWYRV